MQESRGEGLASHSDPESCVGGREAGGEALTGAHTGRVLSRENCDSGMPTPWFEAEGHIDGDCAKQARERRMRCELSTKLKLFIAGPVGVKPTR